MLIAIAVLLALVPAVAVLYPFLRGSTSDELLDDEVSPLAELERRWDTAVAGLRSAELEWSIGTLTEEDYHWLRRRYMREAALVLKAMELEEEQEAELLASIEDELKPVRQAAPASDEGGGASSTKLETQANPEDAPESTPKTTRERSS